MQRQNADLDAYAAARGYTIVGDYCDNDVGASTRSRKKRPQYEAMLAACRAGALDVVIAYTSSRLTRRPREFEDVIEVAERHGVRFEFIRSPSFDLNTADGRMIARMLAAADAAEAERTGERVAREARQRAEDGRPPRGRALGYTRDGMALDEPAATAVREAYEAILAGGGGLFATARHWNELGLLTCHGNPFAANSVRDVLRNPRYAALPVLAGKLLPGVEPRWPAIVEPDVWHGVQAVLGDPGRRWTTTNVRSHLLSGVARCGVCGDRLTSGTAARTRARTLACKGRHLARVAQPIEDLAAAVVIERMGRKDAARLLARPTVDLMPLRTRAAGLREQRAALAADTSLELDFAAARDRALVAELRGLEAKLDAATTRSVLAPFGKGRDPREVWAGLGLDERRAVINELMTLTVLPPGRGARVFRPESVRLAWR